MKAALALAAAALVAVVVAGVLIVGHDRDTTVGAVRSCLRDAGARLVGGADRLGPLRADLMASTLRPGATIALRDSDRALLLTPDDGLYLAAVVTRDAPPTTAVLRALRERPERLPVVAWMPRAASDDLRGCLLLSTPGG